MRLGVLYLLHSDIIQTRSFSIIVFMEKNDASSLLIRRLGASLSGNCLLAQNFASSHEPKLASYQQANSYAPRYPWYIMAPKEHTHSPPCHAPKPRTDSACTLVIRKRFSRSARLADSCASCAWRCDCRRVRVDVLARPEESVLPAGVA